MFRSPDTGTMIIGQGMRLNRIWRMSCARLSNERFEVDKDVFYPIEIATGVRDRSEEHKVLADFVFVSGLWNMFIVSCCIYYMERIWKLCDCENTKYKCYEKRIWQTSTWNFDHLGADHFNSKSGVLGRSFQRFLLLKWVGNKNDRKTVNLILSVAPLVGTFFLSTTLWVQILLIKWSGPRGHW